MHDHRDRIAHTTAFVTSVVEHWLEREMTALMHAGYQRFAVLLCDFSDPNFLDCFPQVLSAWRLLVYHLIHHNSSQDLDLGCSWAIPTQRSCFPSGTQWLTLIGDKERHLAWRYCSRGRFSFSLRNSTYLDPFIFWLGLLFHGPNLLMQ